MNYDIPIRYLARAWYEQPPKLTNPRILGQVSEVLGVEFELTSILRFDSYTGVGGPTSTLVSRETGWQLVAAPDSIDLERHALRHAEKTPSEETLRKVGEAMAVIASASSVPAHRLALVQEGFLREMSEAELTGAATQLLRFPKTFQPAPFEWDWRCVQRVPRTFAGLAEETNAVAIVKRVAGTFLDDGNSIPFDRIRVDIDLNTSPHNETPRFTQAHVQAFYNDATGWHAQLSEELGPCVGIGGQA